MYRFLLKPRWLVLHVVVLCIAVLFSNFGIWQLRRLEQRKTYNALLESRLQQTVTPLNDLLARYDLKVPAADENSVAYRPAVVTGQYDPANEVLLRTTENYEGQPGYYVLTPLRLSDGQALLVERGWVPFDMDTPPVTLAAPPEGITEVIGTLDLPRTPPTDWRAMFSPKNPPGDLEITAYPDTARLSEQMPYTLLPVYLKLTSQTPPQADLPYILPEPEFNNGSHLGYAVQWFAFVIIGLIGYGFLIKQAAREEKTSAPKNNNLKPKSA